MGHSVCGVPTKSSCELKWKARVCQKYLPCLLAEDVERRAEALERGPILADVGQ